MPAVRSEVPPRVAPCQPEHLLRTAATVDGCNQPDEARGDRWELVVMLDDGPFESRTDSLRKIMLMLAFRGGAGIARKVIKPRPLSPVYVGVRIVDSRRPGSAHVRGTLVRAHRAH